MRKRQSVGALEQEVLLAILRRGGESYSVAIVAEIEECTGREVAPAAVYIALRRLEQRGFVSSRKVRKGESERERRYFKLRKPALASLRESRRSLRTLWAGIEPLLDER